ncbi:MAG: Ig-like domain-containing protein, partial [Myxococcaceae bacterium]
MAAPSSLRLRITVVGLIGFLAACGPNGGSADAGTDLGLADPAASSVTVAPTQVPADGQTPAVVTVTLKDANDQVLADRAVQVVAADVQIQPNAQAKTDASGVARFELRSVVPGPKLLKVVVNPGTSSEQLLFEASLSFSAIPAPYLAFEQQPANVVAGEAMPAVQVKFVDASGQTVDLGTTIALSIKNSDADLFGTTSVAAVNGVATFSDLSVWKAGTGL